MSNINELSVEDLEQLIKETVQETMEEYLEELEARSADTGETTQDTP